MKKNHFCTCVDDQCPNNPANTDEGCTGCIEECLMKEEIPVCFFRTMEPDMDRKQDYTYKGFAAFVRKHKGD